MEVTKWLKPSDSGSRIGDRSSARAVTRVNARRISTDLDLDQRSVNLQWVCLWRRGPDTKIEQAHA